MTPRQIETMKAWAAALIDAHKDGSECDPHAVQWAEQLLRANPQVFAEPARRDLLRDLPGWLIERQDSGRIAVRAPDGSGCVVANVAIDERLVPEEVLFALCAALLAGAAADTAGQRLRVNPVAVSGPVADELRRASFRVLSDLQSGVEAVVRLSDAEHIVKHAIAEQTK